MINYFPLLEAIAAITGILSVWYSRKLSILTYPVGIVSVLLYVYLCLEVKLYADAGINAWYFLLSVYGWWRWLRPMAGEELFVQRVDKKRLILGLGMFGLAFPLLYFMLSAYTDSDVPFVDSLTTAVAITGMYWMAEKRLEHWYAWLVVDVVSVPLYLYKDMPVTALQFVVFTILATQGLFIWRKKLVNQLIM
jgi:nicotinamide mononucleotide transporter